MDTMAVPTISQKKAPCGWTGASAPEASIATLSRPEAQNAVPEHGANGSPHRRRTLLGLGVGGADSALLSSKARC